MEQGIQQLAHAAQRADGSWQVHALADHLFAVSDLAAQYARPFGGSPWAALAGLWHDLGKYRPRFQRYLRHASGYEPDAHVRGEQGRAPHSTAGALLAQQRFGRVGNVLAYLIAGHHAGLSDWNSENTSLEHRLGLSESASELEEALAAAPPSEVLLSLKSLPDLRAVPGGSVGFALWVRMLFSCLIDADFLDTEAFMDADKAAGRGGFPDISKLLAQFDAHMEGMEGKASPTPVNKLRSDILRQCRQMAREEPGLFSLTVPTGGGKTLSSLAFALEHAARHGKDRIIYVIPYTSIIEQTADVFRSIFGSAVIEHHSNVDADPSAENLKSRLACENWDARVIVTTSVQFFESLFASRTSRCRKLHNIANSVVVLDEAQLLPPEFLQPILDVLNLLSKHYGVSAVLSTATQPVLSTRDYFDAKQSVRGLDGVREIIGDPDALYEALKRVEVRLPADWHIATDWDTLARELSGRQSVLAVVNRRQDAKDLWQRMPDGTLHLSALMCGAHRSDVIRRIKERLNKGIPTRVVSTQLVEAGVDLDFPVVYRALAGLDSIAQAAGRCNREGRLDKGEVVVFVPPQPAPPGLLRKGENACRSVLHGYAGDPMERRLFARYFERFYFDCVLDKHNICRLLKADGANLAVNFRTAADKFRLIDEDEQVSVIVLYRGGDNSNNAIDDLLHVLCKGGPERWLLRKLQRYTVSIRRKDAVRLANTGELEEVMPGLYAQRSDWLYHPDTGFTMEGVPPTPEQLIVRGRTMKRYCLELSGDFACFTRPEMKVERVSYDIITPSAARACFEAILWKPAIRWHVRRIEVLRPIRWINLRRNEVASVVSARNVENVMKTGTGEVGLYIEDDRQQRAGLFLRDVAYRVHADLEVIRERAGADHPKKYEEMFERRAEKGQCINQPYLGCREFAARFRLASECPSGPLPIAETRDLGFMLHDMSFSNPTDPTPRFFLAQMTDGVVEVPAYDSEEVRG